MRVRVYGIKNCNTMKKTFQLLEQEGIDYDFIDYKKERPNTELLGGFMKKRSLEELINKRGTTYKKLSDEQKEFLENEASAVPIMMENSSMIKRPIIEFPDGALLVGFQEEEIIKKARSK